MAHHLLTKFFQVHQPEFNIMTALKMIEKQMETAKDYHKMDRDQTKYLCYLIKSHKMIENLLNELGVTPADYHDPEKYL